MASQESSTASVKTTTVENNQQKKTESKKNVSQQKSPRKPKGKTSNRKAADNTKAKNKSDTKVEDQSTWKTQKKHEKLVRKAKRIIKHDENTEIDEKSKTDKHKSKEFPIKSLTKEAATKDKEQTDKSEENSKDKAKNIVDEKSSSSKKGISGLKPKEKRTSKAEGSKKDLREETLEEKGHNKDLLDTVYHNMEIEIDDAEHRVKKEPEPVTEIKYKSYDDVSKRVVGEVNALIDTFHEIFQLYKPTEVMLSFNGGKDCTVVLHLLNKFYQMNACLKHIKIPTLYITDPDAFEEVDDFVADCEKLFNIELIKKPGPIKKALEEICKEKPHLKAVFMGCRRTDPYCKDLKMMQPTDAGWPALMRINPIIDWTCRDVWQYMYMYNVPYCSLYQKGYTSIGNKKDTLPNPYLRVIDKATGSIVDYRPGHELIDNDELERAGRIKVPKDMKS